MTRMMDKDLFVLAALLALAAILLVAAFLVLIPIRAQAQQSTIYGPDGRVQGRAATDSQGTTTIYGADGRVTARIATPKKEKRK